MKAFIEFVVKKLVDFPDEVDVREIITDRSLVYEMRLNKSDIGKIIGKQGRTIQALRTLVNNTQAKLGKRAMVEIVEDPPTGTKQPSEVIPEPQLSSETPPTENVT